MGKIIGIIAVKGGVGKTSCTSNLCAAMAHEFRKKVLVVDANFSAPNLGLHLGIVDPEYTIHDVLNDKVSVSNAISSHELGFDVLPASLLGKSFNRGKFKDKIEKLRDGYDVILIDSSPNLQGEMLATIDTADELLVVSSPDYPTLYTTIVAVDLVKGKKKKVTGMVINRVRKKKFELSIRHIEEATKARVIGMLPEDERVAKSIAAVTPATIMYPTAPVSIEYKKIAACLIGEDYKDPRMLYRLKMAMGMRLPQEHVNRILHKHENM